MIVNKGCSIVVVAFFSITAFFMLVSMLSPDKQPEHGITSTEQAPSPPVSIQNPCAVGTPISGHLFVKGNEVPFREGPGASHKMVINQKFTEVTGRTEYRTLSAEYGLEALCQQDDWIQAKITEADGQPVAWETGWIQKKYVSGLPSPERQAGLIWDIDNDKYLTAQEKQLVKKAALRILKEEQDCKEIISGDRSVTKKGQYYVTCNRRSDGQVYNVWFSR